MKTTATLLLAFISLIQSPFAIAQILPDLADRILLCPDGGIPHYRSCEDAPCITEHRDSAGNLLASGNCNEELKTGEWASFYPNGQLRSKGFIANGQPRGYWMFYHSNGKKMARGMFTEGQFELGCVGSGNYKMVAVQTGNWTYWHSNGKVSIQCRLESNVYAQQRFEGKFTSFFENGQKESEGLYRNSERTGTWTYWYPNGQKKCEKTYLYQDCNLYDYISYECPNGIWTYWNDTGELTKRQTYKDGVMLKEEEFKLKK